MSKDLENRKENLTKDVEALKGKLNHFYSGAPNSYEENKALKKEYKKSKKKYRNSLAIRNLCIVGTTLILIAPTVVSSGLIFYGLDSNELHPYHRGTVTKYQQIVYEYDTRGLENKYELISDDLYEEKVILKEPWYKDGENYKRRVSQFASSSSRLNKDNIKDIVNYDYDYIKSCLNEHKFSGNGDGYNHHTDTKLLLTEEEKNEDYYVYVSCVEKNKDKSVKVKQDVGRTVGFGAIHLLATSMIILIQGLLYYDTGLYKKLKLKNRDLKRSSKYYKQNFLEKKQKVKKLK